MKQALSRIRAVRQGIQVCEQSYRRSCRNRTELDYFVLVIEKPREKAGKSAQLL